jgi:MFS family permease
MVVPMSTPASTFTTSSPPPTTASATPAQRRRWGVAFGLYTAATNATFTQAVWVIFLATHGYSPFAIGLFEMGFHVAKFAAEIPTGIFADLYGRRASLLVAAALGALAPLLYLHPTAPLIAAEFAVQGLAFAFRGGADSALLWALAERSGGPDTAARYSRLFSRLFLVTLAAQTVGVASGGALSDLNAVLPFLCSAGAMALSIAPLLMLPEVRAGQSGQPGQPGQPGHIERPHPIAHLLDGLHAARRDPLLLGLLALSALTAAVMTTIGYYTQLYFRALGFSLAAVGLVFAATIVPDALCAASAPRLIKRVPRRWVLALFVGAEALGLLLMATQVPVFGLAGFLVLLHAGDSVLYPALSTYINERSPEAQRATVLSLDTGLFSALMIVLFPLFGLGLTHISFGAAYTSAFVALLAGSGAIAAGVRLSRNGMLAPHERLVSRIP